MQCPVDGKKLKISDKEGIEIDYCPECRGVWLDRGELEKIIERADRYESRAQHQDDDDDEEPRGKGRRGRSDNDDEGGFLGNIFGGFGGRDD
jgi:uncharacterized protein